MSKIVKHIEENGELYQNKLANGETHRGQWWIISNELVNGETHRGESKDGLRVGKDYYKE